MQQEALLSAVERGDFTSVRRTLEAWGAWAASATDRAGYTAVMRAALHGRRRVLKLLLRWGADSNAREPREGRTALHLLCAARPYPKREELCEYLITRGADPDAADAQGRRALHVAAEQGWTGLVSVLLNQRADLEAVDSHRRSPLHVAAAAGSTGVVEVMLRWTYPASTVARDADACTPLHHAAAIGHADIAALLIDEGSAAVSPRRGDGLTPLHLACAGPADEPPVEGGGAPLPSPNQSPPATAAAQKRDSSPLVAGAGASASFDAVVTVLLARGADTGVLDTRGRTALHVAAETGRAAAIALLFEADADVRARDLAGDTPLHAACRADQPHAVAAMLAHGATPNDRNSHGDTSIHVCCALGRLDCLRELFRHECDPNLKNFAHRSALGEARVHGQRGAEALLLEEFVQVELDAAGRAVRRLEVLSREEAELGQQLAEQDAQAEAKRQAAARSLETGWAATISGPPDPFASSSGAALVAPDGTPLALEPTSARKATERSQNAQGAGGDGEAQQRPRAWGASLGWVGTAGGESAAEQGDALLSSRPEDEYTASYAPARGRGGGAPPGLEEAPASVSPAGRRNAPAGSAPSQRGDEASGSADADAARASAAAPVLRSWPKRPQRVAKIGTRLGKAVTRWTEEPLPGSDSDGEAEPLSDSDDDGGGKGVGGGLQASQPAASAAWGAPASGGGGGGGGGGGSTIAAASTDPGASADDGGGASGGGGRDDDGAAPGGGLQPVSGAARAAHGGVRSGRRDADAATSSPRSARPGLSSITKEGEAMAWERRHRLGDGSEYWFNRATGESRANRPAELGGGWEAVFDPDRARVVWRDPSTGRVALRDPEATAAARLAAKGEGRAQARKRGGTDALPSRVELRRRRDPLRDEVGEEAVADYAAEQRDLAAEVAEARTRIAAARRIQAGFRRGRALRALRSIRVLRVAAVEAQRVVRGWLGRREAQRRRRARRAATDIQRVWRGLLGRRLWFMEWEEQAVAWGSLSIQRVWRGFCGRRLANTARARQMLWAPPGDTAHWRAMASAFWPPLRRWRGWLEFAVVPPPSLRHASGRDWAGLQAAIASAKTERKEPRGGDTRAVAGRQPSGSVDLTGALSPLVEHGSSDSVWTVELDRAASGEAGPRRRLGTGLQMGRSLSWRAQDGQGEDVTDQDDVLAGQHRPLSRADGRPSTAGSAAAGDLEEGHLPRLPRAALGAVPGDAARVYLRWRDWRAGEGAEATAVRFGRAYEPRFRELSAEQEDALFDGLVRDDARAAASASAERAAAAVLSGAGGETAAGGSAAAATAASAASAGAAGRAPASPPAGPLHRRWADGEGRIGQPRAWLRAERRQSLALDQLLRRGWTDEEDTAARTVQWYYKQAVRLREERARRRAVEKMEGAEAAYLDSPKSVVARMNYALWCQTVGRSLERARPLYLGLVDHMARRGPDHPLILYGFCLLLAATMGESMEVIEALAQRARRADIAKGGESFADAERGFFAEALRRRPDDPEALLGMALVLTFVHGQVDAAEPLFLRAMDLAPTRRGLVEVFTFALQERGGRDYDGHEAFRRMLEKRATAEAKEVAARMLNAASGDRALLIQRVWRGYRTRDALAVLRRAAAQQGPLSGWMRVDPEPAPPGEEPMARYWFHAESGVSAWTRPTLVADWEGLRACGIVTGFGVVSGGGCELAGLWRGRAPRPGPQGWRRRLDGRGFERLAARSFAPDDSEASRWRDGQDQAAAVCPPKGRPPLLHGADPREWEEHEAPPGSDEEQFWFNRTTGESRWSAPRWDRRPATMVAIGAVTRRHAARHEESPLLTEEGSAWNYALDSLADSAQATASPKRRKFAGRMATGRGKAGWRPAPPPGMEFALRKRQRAEEAANARALFDAPLIADGPPSAPRDARSGRAAGAGHWERTSEEPSGGEEAKRDGVVVWVNAVTGEVHEGRTPPLD
ncbi:hypothetical protein FNF29_00475 [Cafeteria roenbergensis]|uniref:WW domain-containing protein n=3 Tax=Cafeteria roenbergensis TaxID=33653 RepID=A0A5A8CVE3_CAFRO|nr:hypothetical protein FNF29_00475 [Cafeteria roenbergensis]|eukprot:KAA0157123.1 hypothetical protein FNF29_00475 [Cafeteria roenbergensis]